jgi:hypothetical protein
MRQWLQQRRTWTLTLACWVTGVLVASGLSWHALGPHQPAFWARMLLLCGIWIAVGGCVRQFVLRGLRNGSSG